MQKCKTILKQLWQDESAQGMAEYVLLIVIVMAVFAIFGPKIKAAITTKTDAVSNELQNATVP
jgi:Flp pilus assembly pilin Flp